MEVPRKRPRFDPGLYLPDMMYKTTKCCNVALAVSIIAVTLIVLNGRFSRTPMRLVLPPASVKRQPPADVTPADVQRQPRTFNSTDISDRILGELKAQEAKHADEGCNCPGGYKNVGPQTLSQQTLNVRNDAYRKWKEREQIVTGTPPVALCPGNSPIQFVSSGIEIEPMQSTRLVGLAVTSATIEIISRSEHVEMILRSVRGLGHLSLQCPVKVSVDGSGTDKMSLSIDGENAEMLDAALTCVKYESTVDVVDEWETIIVRFLGNEMNIHIRIRRKPLPFLYRTSSVSPPIHERVTIVTKTFERYEQVNRLIDSVFKFYPNMSIIIADDSVHFETIDKKNVLHYKMPAQIGWFAGRNLGISQVMTEYFVWADDDYVFTEKTKLELFVEKLDKVELGLDIVAGYLGSKAACGRTCVKVGEDRDGHCITIKKNCDHGRVPGYPQCVHVDRATNFFMARTRSVQKVGFDPHFNHIGHIEFFMDGYHSLKSVCCTDVQADHVRGGSAFYRKNRDVNGELLKAHQTYIAYKYNAKCQVFA